MSELWETSRYSSQGSSFAQDVVHLQIVNYQERKIPWSQRNQRTSLLWGLLQATDHVAKATGHVATTRLHDWLN